MTRDLPIAGSGGNLNMKESATDGMSLGNRGDAPPVATGPRFVNPWRSHHPSRPSSNSPARDTDSPDSAAFPALDESVSEPIHHEVTPSKIRSSRQAWIHNPSAAIGRSAKKDPSTPGSQTSTPRVDKNKSLRGKAHIIPLLKRATHDESMSVDLSRSAVENEGLGIYTN